MALPALPEAEAPWGELEIHHVVLAPPPGYIDTEDCSRWHLEAWQFAGYTRESLERLVNTATRDPALRARMMGMTRCDDVGCALTPTLELEDAMDPQARAVLFDALAAWPGNTYQVLPWRRPRRHGPWHELPGLTERTRRLFAQSTWTRGDDYLFADIPWMCARLETEAERLQMMQAIKTRYGLTARVRVAHGAPIDGLVAWWSRGTSAEHARALFEAAARVPDGAMVPVPELLPPVVRRRLSSFPGLEEPLYDCFWTALHFFGSTPTTHLPGPDGFAAALQNEYERIPLDQVRLGDVITFVNPGGVIEHAVNHVAGDLVLTKNGGFAHRPWALASLSDVRALYPLTSELRAWRLRPVAAP